MQLSRQTLSAGWRMREAERPGVPAHNFLPWLAALVPGCVHLDLMRAGVIADPFAGLQERSAAWVDSSDWIYETHFSVPDPDAGAMFLVFEGLDTVAEIVLNGQVLGHADNMFVPYKFCVTGCLHREDNHLQVTFRSAKRVGQERWQAWNDGGNDTLPAHWDNWNARAFVRKAQYMYGWDWGPVLLSCGLWRSVELVAVPVARLGDWKHSVEFNEDGAAIVTVDAEIERTPGHETTRLALTLALEGVGAVTAEVQGSAVRAALFVGSPRLWWPNGSGEPALYNLSLTLAAEDAVDSKTAQIGLRTIALVREADSDGRGEGFKFRVNGMDIFAKGANWIPGDSFPARLAQNSDGGRADAEDAVAERLVQAARASFNMLRVWGGGFYESDHFYGLCDKLGLLVWQDFPYACSYYPDTGTYAEAARAEAVTGVRRIRHHAALALWCGNNENQMMFDANWTGHLPPRLLGDHLYHEVLPAVVALEDPHTPYWPGSPFGSPPGASGGDVNHLSNSDAFGDCHNWDVWHGRGDWVHYAESEARFCSEFGFASSCGLAAWDAVLRPDDAAVASCAVRWHDKTRKGYETYLGYVGLHYPAPQSLEDLVYFSQLNQADALKFGVEHYRRLKGRCWGTLFWQLNDCWPVQSWAVVDYRGEPKAAWYAARRFYAPVLLSLVQGDGCAVAHLTSDLPHAVAGILTLTLETADGDVLALQQGEASVGPNGTQAVMVFDLTASRGRERDAFLHARFAPGTAGADIENILLLAEPKDLQVGPAGVAVDVAREGRDVLVITLTARRFAPCVWLRRADHVPLAVDDNFFHLRAGECRRVRVACSADLPSAQALQARLVVRTL